MREPRVAIRYQQRDAVVRFSLPRLRRRVRGARAARVRPGLPLMRRHRSRAAALQFFLFRSLGWAEPCRATSGAEAAERAEARPRRVRRRDPEEAPGRRLVDLCGPVSPESPLRSYVRG